MKRCTIGFAILVLISVTFYLFGGSKNSKLSSSEFQSHQSGASTLIQSKTEDELPKVLSDKSASEAKTHSRSKQNLNARKVAEASPRTNPVERYLNEEFKGLRYSTEIVAVPKDIGERFNLEVIAASNGFVFIKKGNTSIKSYDVVQRENDPRVGVFVNKLLVIQRRSKEFEEKLKGVVGDRNVNFMGGIYFIDVKGVEESIGLVTTLKSMDRKLQVDLDINYSFEAPK